MSDINDLFAEYLGPTPAPALSPVDTKKANLLDTTEEKKARLRGYDQGAAMDVGLREGTVDSDFLLGNFGQENDEIVAGRNDYMSDASRTRTPIQFIGDSVNDILSGAISGGLNVGAAVGGIADKAIGTNIGGTLTDWSGNVSDFAHGLQSDELAGHRRAYEAKSGITSEHNAALEQEEIGNGDSPLIAGLRRFGRDFERGLSNGDGATVSSGIANGVGSLLLGGAMGKALRSVGVAEKLAMPGAIAALEGGGAYQQANAEVMAMSHEQLLKGSPEYADLIKSGMTASEAKIKIANDAGLLAGAIQAPIGLATGKLVSKFEGNPFRVPTLGTAAGNILREGVEEGAQSLTGQAASNYAVKSQADENKDMLDGLGEQTSQGALFGLGTAGVVQLPGAPGAAVRDTAKVAKKVGKAALTVASEKAGDIISGIKANSPVATEALRTKFTNAKEAILASGALDTLKEKLVKANPEQVNEIETSIERVRRQMQMDPAAEAEQETSPRLKELVGNSTDRFDAMDRAVQLIDDEKTSETDRLDAGLYLVRQLANNKDLLSSFDQAMADAVDDSPEHNELRKLEDVLVDVKNNPTVQKAIETALKHAESLSVDQVDNDPAAMEAAAQVAELAPEKAKLDVTTRILQHAEDGKLDLTPDRRQAVEATKAMLEAEAEHASTNAIIEKHAKDKNPNIVAQGIRQSNKDDREAGFLSGRDYQTQILSAYRVGNKTEASRNLNELKKFAQHLQNKVAAINENLATGTGQQENATKYLSLTRGGKKFVQSEKGLYINPEVPQSIALAQQIESDAKVITDLTNKLSGIFKNLGVDPLENVSLDASLQGNIENVARKHRKEKWKETRLAQPKAEPKAESQPAREKAPEKVVSAEAKPQPKPEPVKAKEPVAPKEEPAPKPEPAPEDKPVEKQAAAEPKSEGEVSAAAETSEETRPADTKTKLSDFEDDAVETAQTKKDILEFFPKLLDKATKFFSSFKPGDTSRLLGNENPLRTVYAAMASNDGWRALAGANAKGTLTPALANAYRAYLKTHGGTVMQTLEQRLQKVLDKTSKDRPFADILKDGETDGRLPTTFVNGKVLNLVEQDEDGNLVYNKNLMDSAILAALQWALTADQFNSMKDAERVGKILGISPADVSGDQLAFFQTGIPMIAVKQDLARQIKIYWGVKDDANGLSGYTDGIPEAMAAEIMHGLYASGLFKDDPKLKGKFAGKDWTQIQIDMDREDVKAVLPMPTAIEAVAVTEPEEVFYFGAPPEKVADTQLRNRQVPLTKNQKKMVEANQKTPHHFNTNMFELYNALVASTESPELLVELFGDGPITENTNIEYAKRMASRNLMVTSAMRTLGMMMNNMDNQGHTPETVEIFYPYEVSSVGRLQMQGAFNPQANKLMREVILPTRATMDLTNEDNLKTFKLAVAQHWGVKVETMSLDEAVAKVDEMVLDEDMNAALEMLSTWDSNRSKPLTKANVQLLKAAFKDTSPAALHAATEYVRYLNQDEAGKQAFTTSLYIEADGKTDGPINALMHMTGGAFSGHWIRMMAKGGMYLGQQAFMSDGQPMSLNEYIRMNRDNPDGSGVDLYGYAAANTLSKLRANWSAASDLRKQQMTAVIDLLSELRIGMNKDDGNLAVERGFLKNPLTITVYGSGERGIAGNVANEVLEKLYEMKSNGEPLSQKAQAALGHLVSTNVWMTKEGKEFLKKHDNAALRNMPDKTFKISEQQFGILRDNILQEMIPAMKSGIDSAIGESLSNVNLLQQATQLQSLIASRLFYREVQKLLDAKESRSDGLTKAEIDRIWADNKFFVPFMETGEQTFSIPPTGRVDLRDQGKVKTATTEGRKSAAIEFSSSLTGEFASPGTVSAPLEAGVRGIPMTIIGPGDGAMIQNGSIDPEMPENLPVFDGVNYALDKIRQGSELINKAVHQGWMGNTMAAIFESYDKMLANADMSILEDPELRFDIAEALRQNDADTVDISLGFLEDIRDRLHRASLEIQARKAVLSDVGMVVDHMATAQAPYVAEGKTELRGNTPEEQAVHLNELLEIKLAELAKANPDARLQHIRLDVSPELANIGTARASGVREASIQEIRAAIQSVKLPPEHKTMIEATTNKLLSSGYRVILGSLEAINADRAEQGLSPLKIDGGGNRTVNGFTLPDEQRMYLINPSSEVLAHELIHAATLEQVTAYYSNPESLTPEQRAAVQSIEAMMNEALESKAWAYSTDGFDNMVRAIDFHEADPAAALNEFMAWTLTNQSLVRAAKSTSIKSKFAKMASDMIEAIKTLIWGKRNNAPRVGDDFYSNLAFNTRVLMQNAPSMQVQLGQSVMYHSTSPNNDKRVADLFEKVANKMAMFMHSQPTERERALVESNVGFALRNAMEVAASFEDRGFHLTPEQRMLFEAITTAMATEIELDPNALARANQLYAQVMPKLTEEMFMADPVANNFNDRQQANEKLNVLLGNYLVKKDAKGRTSLLPSFMALAATHDQFRFVLESLPIDKSEQAEGTSTNARLENFGTGAMDRLTQWASGQGNAANVREAIDALTDQMARNMAKERNLASQGWDAAGNFYDTLNDKVAELMQVGSEKAYNALERAKARTTNKAAQGALAGLQWATAIINETNSGILAEGAISAMNNSPAATRGIRELMVEIIGRTKSNASIYDMIKKVRSYVQQTRQRFREDLPKVIADQFKQKLTKDQWTAMTKGLGKMDMASLVSLGSVSSVIDMLANPAAVNRAIVQLEDELQTMDSTNWNLRQTKAKELAAWMNTGKPSGSLLRNATAIANLYNEMPTQTRKRLVERTVTPEMIEKIDQLTSLYAYQQLDVDTKDALASLVQDEREGLEYTLSSLVGIRKDEMAKVEQYGRQAANNYYKGHVPLENDATSSLIVADNHRATDLQLMGYTRVADYEGSQADRDGGSKSYFFTTVQGRAGFKQGIMQNVRKTAFGIDPHTGFTVDSTSAGVINDPQQVARIARLQALNGRGTGEPLLPVIDSEGEIIAYERSIAPEQHARLNINRDLSKVMGIWQGRQVEEHYATRFNHELVRNLAAKWDEEKASKATEYVDLFSHDVQKDAVIRDAVKLFSPEARAMINSYFPDGKFMVRNDLLNDVIGYRSVSVGDAWTGISRLPKEMQRVIKDVSIAVFGKEAFRKIVQAERVYQNIISDAKVTIVVKSVVVPVANIMSNVVHLVSRGVPIGKIAKGFPKKAAEVDSFLRNQQKMVKLEADMRAAEGRQDQQAVLTYRNQLRGILDANRRLSIWPLIEAGELSSISDTGLSHEEVLVSEGKISEYMQQFVNKLPPSLQTAAKYGMVSPDTALFKGLQRAVLYGDFLAKAVLFDELTGRKGQTPAKALTQITEEFVNYDRQPGRSRGYMEDMGLLWFWNFKLRSMKVALSVIRNNPLHALVANLLPVPDVFGSVGTPVSDNMLSVIADGRLSYSMGLDQLFHAHALNPWINLVD